MKKFLPFLRLIRFPNLLIIALTMYLVRFCLISPMLNMMFENMGFEITLAMKELDFFLLCLSAVMIAAAGYIINDYFDIRIDRINRPEKIIIGRLLKRRVAMGAHLVMNILGFLIGAYVSLKIGHWKLAFIHVFAITSLWFYSTHFKRRLLTGNIIIALLAALIPLIVGVYEIPLVTVANFKILRIYDTSFNFIIIWICTFAGFAFLITLAREITKDVIDIKGDEVTGCKTVPIVWGKKVANNISTGIYTLMLMGITLLWQTFLIGTRTISGEMIQFDMLTFLYLLVLVYIPLLIISYKTYVARKRKDLVLASNFNKAVAVFGVLYMLVVYYNINYVLGS